MKTKILLALMILATSLAAIKNWESYTNTTHLYDVIEYNNEIYISTWGGVLRYQNGQELADKKLTEQSGLRTNDVRSLSLSSAGDLLLAHSVDGIDRLMGQDFILPITEEIGLPTNNVNKVISKDSFIYVATEVGISIFEENDAFPIPVLRYQINQSDGLSNTDITSMEITDNGFLFCGGILGLDYITIADLNGGSWTHFDANNSLLNHSTITSIASNGTKLVAGTLDGMVMVDLENFDLTVFDIANYQIDNRPVYPVQIDDRGDIWFGLGEWDEGEMAIIDSVDIAVCRLSSSGEFTAYNKSELGLLSTAINNIKQIDETLYILTWGEGFVTYDLTTKTWGDVKATEGIGSNFVRDLQMDENQNLWISSGREGNETSSKNSRGLSVYNGANWTIYNKFNSNIPTESIYKITIDNNNNKWFASWGSGISYYIENTQTFYNLNLNNYPELMHQDTNGSMTAPSRTATFIETLNNGEIAFSTYPDHIGILDGFDLLQEFHLGEADYEYSDFMTIKQFDDFYIVGCRYNGVLFWEGTDYPTTDGDNWVLPQPSQLRGCGVTDIQYREASDGRDEYWFATDQGLFCYKEKPAFYLDNESLPAGFYWYRYGQESKKKQIYAHNDWEDFETPEFWYVVGQPYLYGGAITIPTKIFIDPFGKVWIGTIDNGFTIYDIENDEFIHYNTENSQLIDNIITDFEYDKLTGKLFIGTSRGLNSVDIGLSQEYNTETKLNDVIAYPNPFNPDKDGIVRIENKNTLTMPAGKGTCKILDISGDFILELDKNEFEQFSWDGNNSAGKKCSSGVYFYLISAGDGQTAKGKIVLIR